MNEIKVIGIDLAKFSKPLQFQRSPPDTPGQAIDFLLTVRLDAGAALSFFRKVIRHHDEPEVATIAKSGANTAALALNAYKPEEERLPSGRTTI